MSGQVGLYLDYSKAPIMGQCKITSHSLQCHKSMQFTHNSVKMFLGENTLNGRTTTTKRDFREEMYSVLIYSPVSIKSEPSQDYFILLRSNVCFISTSGKSVTEAVYEGISSG